ncbi:hypothetical protein [Propioniciclava tarda]|uniref:Uncharacterized protein n=1 Tax=Propioniciclava tarda TaxID=433330 RepID=A0A4Q9KN14_PROTD|nr:hypothetical protein [Propioniciclava tarda]TBT95938.1 hypothetical protein ET996_02905 [Propioniciclava tarda]
MTEGTDWRRIESGCVAYASAVRALVDAGRYCELDAAGMRALAIRLLQSGDVAEGELATELTAGRLNHTLPVRTGLRDFVTGAWSLPEAWLAQLVRGRGLPAMAHNVTLSTLDGRRIGTPDGYFLKAAVAVQVRSRQFHTGLDDRGRDRWEETVEQDGAYAAAGILCLGVTPTTLRGEPDRLLERCASALRSRTGSAIPAIRVGERQPRCGDPRPATVRSA